MRKPLTPRLRDIFSMRQVCAALSLIERGELSLHLPDGKQQVFHGPLEGQRACIEVKSWNFFWRIVSQGSIGLGESFQADEWSSPNPAQVVRLMIENRDFIFPMTQRFSFIRRLSDVFKHRGRANTLGGSKGNIAAHYDLSNDLFALFLDESMTYSSAIYKTGDGTLEQAQMNKVHAMLSKARLSKDLHVLEIGSGWGTLAIEAARMYGCKVTSLTLSQQQLTLARQRVAAAGLSELVDIKLCDYRTLEGQFDRVISVEMLEAVGHEYLGEYFGAIERLLEPEGLAVIQVITMPDHRYQEYRKRSDWIQKYIFPGSLLPSLTALSEASTRCSKLMLENLENIGPHYARTLAEWRARFMAASARATTLGFDGYFQRTWIFYLAYCEAAFASRTLNVLQLVYTRENNATLLMSDSGVGMAQAENVLEFQRRACG
ncbi:MAG: cyclopropane-fatty-acyl-phospholipid synthase family protein [Oligoflexia bacterium]|nr:cyclopropane-fatty-acyl-phospholipid synthase family protein [Oligoflexia bacterium]